MVTKGIYFKIYRYLTYIFAVIPKSKQWTKLMGIAILGGIALKIHQPSVVTSINVCLNAEGLDELPGAQLPGTHVPTVYRIENMALFTTLVSMSV